MAPQAILIRPSEYDFYKPIKCLRPNTRAAQMAVRLPGLALRAADHARDAAAQLWRQSARMNSATRSPIMMVGILVLALGARGITEASATRNPVTP
jgi:hypothetical protein